MRSISNVAIAAKEHSNVFIFLVVERERKREREKLREQGRTGARAAGGWSTMGSSLVQVSLLDL